MENFLNDLECIAAKYGHVTDEDDPGKFLSEYEDDLQNDISSEDQLDDSDSTEDSFLTTYTEEEGRFLAKLRNCLIKMEKSEPPPPLEEYPRDILIEDDWGNEEPNHGPCEDSPAAFHITKLSDWYLSVTNQKSVIINGRRCISNSDTVKTEDDDWHTTSIKMRIGNNPKKLMTISGSIYYLEGEINEGAMQENNFPMSVIERFRFGFPKDWQTIIKDLLLNFSTRQSIETTKGTSVTYSDTDELLDSLESSSPPKRTVENWKDSHDENSRNHTLAPNKRRKLEWEATPDIIFDFPAENVFTIPQFAQSCTALDSGTENVKDDVKPGKDDDLLSKCSNRDLGDNCLLDTEIKMKIAVKHEDGDNNDTKGGNVVTKRRKKCEFYTGNYKKRKHRTINKKGVPVKKDFTKIESMPISINEKRRRPDFKETYLETDFKGTKKADDVKQRADIVLKNDSRPKFEISCEIDHDTIPSGLREGIRIEEKQDDTKKDVNTLRFPNKGEQMEVTTCDKILAKNPLVYIQPIKLDDYRNKISKNCMYVSDRRMEIAQSNPNTSNSEQNQKNSIEISEPVPGEILIPKSAKKDICQSSKMLPDKKKEVRLIAGQELNPRREKKFKDKSFTSYYSQVRKKSEKNYSLAKHSLVRNYQRHPSFKTNRVDRINKLSQTHCATANPSVGILKSPRVYIEPLQLQGYRRKASEKMQRINAFDDGQSESKESSLQRNRSVRVTRFSKTPHASVNRSDIITDSSDDDMVTWASAHSKELVLSRNRSKRLARQQENVHSKRAAQRRLSKNQTEMCDNNFVGNQPRIAEALSIAHEGHIDEGFVQHRRANSQRNSYQIETLSSSDTSTQSSSVDVPENPDLSYNQMTTLNKIRSPTVSIPQQTDLGFSGMINTNDNRMHLGHAPENLDHSSNRVSKFRRAWNTFVNVPRYPESSFDRERNPSLKSGRRCQKISICPSIPTQIPTKEQVSPKENFVKRKYKDNPFTSPRDLTVAHGNQHVSVFVPSRKLSVRADSEVMMGEPRGSLSSHQKNFSPRPLGSDHKQRSDSWKKRLKSRERISGRMVIEEDWREDEMEKLKLAVSRFQPDRPYYWQKISDFVESRNPAECQRKFELIRNPCKRGPGPVKKKIQKVVRPQVEAGANFRDVVTAGRGTLKRKKQMRQFLEAQDRDYEDDVFESTPYRNRKKRIKLPIDPSKFSMVFDSDDFPDGNSSLSSSPAFSSSDSDISLAAASILGSADRDKADAYMLRYEKMRKKMPLNAEMRNTKDRTSTKKNQNSMLGLSPSQGFCTKQKYDYDEDSLENDDYFEDEDDNY